MTEIKAGASTVADTWGPLAHPIDHGRAATPRGRAQWRDNAYVSFWDVGRRTFGNVHVSTSASPTGRLARATLSIEGVMREVREPLESGSFESGSIAFGLDGMVRVAHPDMTLDLRCRPVLALADFNARGVIPQMGDEPLRHFQRTVAVRGTASAGGRTVELDARGVRDRTWGPRDESVNISEYVWYFVAFETWSLTAMRFTGAGGFDRTDGFVLTDEARSVTGLDLVRDARGLAAAATFRPDAGAPVDLRAGSILGGFWVPMGSERRGPAMSCYDEFSVFHHDGETGFGVTEHGTVRHLY